MQVLMCVRKIGQVGVRALREGAVHRGECILADSVQSEADGQLMQRPTEMPGEAQRA